MNESTNYRERIYQTYASQFQGASEKFDESAARRWGQPYRHYFRNWLPADKNAAILDLACGNGHWLYFLKQEGYTQLYGVDISPEQVALAKQVTPNISEDNILNFLRSTPGKFDLITGLDIIEHLKKDEALDFLDGCLASLRPGGRLILQTPNADSPWFGHIRYGDFTHEIAFTPASLEKLMRLCGFGTVEARPAGPVAQNLVSIIRCGLWKVMSLKASFASLAETGYAGSGIFTRVFFASGLKAK